MPRVRVRQWVLSLLFALRVPLAFRHELTLAVHRVAARVIEGFYRTKARTLGIADGRTGGIMVVQRFGSDLALNVHFHSRVLDGVFEGSLFVPIEAPTLAEMETLCGTIAHRIGRMLARRAVEHDDRQERALALALSRAGRDGSFGSADAWGPRARGLDPAGDPETYGAGNAPDTRRDMLDVLEEAIGRGLVVLNVTQCLRGTASGAYAAGRALAEVGVIPGADLTPEAALTKLAHVLGRGLKREEALSMLRAPLRGEMTVD